MTLEEAKQLLEYPSLVIQYGIEESKDRNDGEIDHHDYQEMAEKLVVAAKLVATEEERKRCVAIVMDSKYIAKLHSNPALIIEAFDLAKEAILNPTPSSI